MFAFLICAVVAVGQAKEGPYLPSPPGTRPKGCLPKGTTYCEQVDDYPEDVITKLLAKSNGSFVFRDERQGLQEPPSDLVLGRSLARGGLPFLRVTRSATCEYNPFCPVRSRTVHPKAAIDQNGGWKYVNKIPVAMKLCRKIKGIKKKSFQQYTVKKLYALDAFGNLKPDWFVFPSCCSCCFDD